MVLLIQLQSLGLDIKLYNDQDEEIEIKEHTEEALDGVDERIDESDLTDGNLNEVDEDELDNDYSEDNDDEFFTNILDEDDIPDDKIFKDLDSEE